MTLLTNEQQESYENAKICYICKEEIKDKYAKDKKYRKDRDHCHWTSESEVLDIGYVFWSKEYLRKFL